jgi:GTP cyclohydrolase II
VIVHFKCLTRDIFGSARCGSRDQLDLAMTMIENTGQAVVVYLRGQLFTGLGCTIYRMMGRILSRLMRI